MIDKNGKIGGKVSIIDLLILVVLIAVALFVGRRLLSGGSSTPPAQQVYMEMIGSEVLKYVSEDLEVGAPVIDDTEHNSLGHVTEIELGKAYHYEALPDGSTVIVEPDDSDSVRLVTLQEGSLDGNGVLVNGTRYAIGHTFVVYAGNCKLYVRISGLEAA